MLAVAATIGNTSTTASSVLKIFSHGFATVLLRVIAIRCPALQIAPRNAPQASVRRDRDDREKHSEHRHSIAAERH